MMKRGSQTMDPRSLLATSTSGPGPSLTSRQHAAYARGSSRPTGRTVYDTSSTHASHPLAPPPPPPPNGEHSYFASTQGYSTSAPSASTALHSPPLPPDAHAPSTAPPQLSPQLGLGTGGKVRKGKDRTARPVLGLRIKSEDGLVDGHGAKVRAQYSACGACRMRRVKCDLHDIKAVYRTNVLPQHLSVLMNHPNSQAISDNGGYELISGELVGLDGLRIACSNCKERGLRCVDGLAAKELSKAAPLPSPTLTLSTSPSLPTGPVMSASGRPKMLRKGKRIQMVQSTFGGGVPPAVLDPAALTAARAAPGSRRTTVSSVLSADESVGSSSDPSPDGDRSDFGDTCLTEAFLRSPFYQRLMIQRPLLHAEDFERRFRSTSPAVASNLGPTGAIVVKTLFAWARAFGVDSDGNEDVQPMTPAIRQQRRRECSWIVESCLADIDRLGVMRKPSWDGVQALLLLLPLTQDTSSASERLVMYECAVGQVATLTAAGALGSSGGLGADPFAESGPPNPDEVMTQVRLYWYSFVNESIKTGLKGGRLILDEEDLADFQRSAASLPFTRAPSHFSQLSQYASTPIELAVACRLVHKALTGPQARRAPAVDAADLHRAWTSIDNCWQGFDRLRTDAQANPLVQHDDLQRFCDGWMVFLFECQSVIREALYDRYARILRAGGPDAGAGGPPAEHHDIGRLHAIAEGKCLAMSQSMITIIWRNLGGPLFQYDSGLVRDGTYFTACVLAADGGTPDEINCCLTALGEMRWAYARSDERSDHVRAIWSARLEREAGQSKTGGQPAAFTQPQAQQAAFSDKQRPAPGPRNYSYQSEQSDASYRSEQSEPHYVPAFYAADDVHLPPIQGQFGQQASVPPALLRGLNLSDETIQELPTQGTPMWIDAYTPADSAKQSTRDSAMSTPSAYTGDSPLQALSSDQSSRSQTGDSSSASYSSRSNGAIPGGSSITGSPAPGSTTTGVFFRASVGPGQGTYAATAPYDQSPLPTGAGSDAYLSAAADTYAPYGDETSQDDHADAAGSASYANFYPSTT